MAQSADRHASRTAAVGLAAGLFAFTTPAAQQPTFRAATDVVLVEVQVVQRDGRPARGLAPGDFEVAIDRRRRQILAADLMVYQTLADSPIQSRPVVGPSARNVWPGNDAVGRTFVLAIDAVSFPAGEGAQVVKAAGAFVDSLGPNDAVGLVSLPRGAILRPTTDRVAIAQSLSRVAGLQALRANPFHLTNAEIIDINAEIDQMAASAMTSVTARGRVQVTTVQDVLRQVQTRECRGTADQVCLQEIVVDADSQARLLDEQVSESLAGFTRLLALLAEYPGRKTVIVLSAGMPVNDRTGGWHRDGGEARALGRAAAIANATIYAIHVDQGYSVVYGAENRLTRHGVSLARERDLAQRLLADFASSSGGALFEAPTDTGGRALARVLDETSAFYAIGVRAEPRDLDGGVHELKVGLKDSALTVRAPRFVLLRRP